MTPQATENDALSFEKAIPSRAATPRVRALFEVARASAAADPAHDFGHSLRVLGNALRIASVEGGEPELLAAAALLHDLANYPKDHPQSHLSSERSAARARDLLAAAGFGEDEIERVSDAIVCHSYSRGLDPRTLEGRVFQDADRLDSLGAVGIARTFTVGGALGRPLFHARDPFLETGREPDDKDNTLDHFFRKLLKLADRMQTETGRRIGRERTERLTRFISELKEESDPKSSYL